MDETPANKAPQDKLAGVDDLVRLCANDMNDVNQLIRQRMSSDVPVIPALADHLIAAGGKRLRPLLCIAAALLCESENTDHHKLAAAVEFIHTATLLHDDVVDQSSLRRGKTAAHLIWGAPSSVLVGDFLFARAFELMVETGSLSALDILSKASAIITEGEVMQLSSAFDPSMSEETYLKVISAKTAALFSAAAHSGAVTAKASAAHCEALSLYGHYLGLAFQIRDDVLDYVATAGEIGKNAGDDFSEGKMTLPLIYAARDHYDEDTQFWERIITKRHQTPEDFPFILTVMHKTNALERAMDKARGYGRLAREALEPFVPSLLKDALIGLSFHSVERKK